MEIVSFYVWATIKIVCMKRVNMPINRMDKAINLFIHTCQKGQPHAVMWLVKTVTRLKCWLLIGWLKTSWLSYIKLMKIGRRFEIINQSSSIWPSMYISIHNIRRKCLLVPSNCWKHLPVAPFLDIIIVYQCTWMSNWRTLLAPDELDRDIRARPLTPASR